MNIRSTAMLCFLLSLAAGASASYTTSFNFFYTADLRLMVQARQCQQLLIKSHTPTFTDTRAQRAVTRFYLQENDPFPLNKEAFALNLMADRGVIPAKEVGLYLKDTQSIEPSRLMYVGISRSALGPAFYIRNSIHEPFNSYTKPDQNISFLRSVSGQTDDEKKFLPWQNDLRLNKVTALIDRTAPDQQFVYEWGRAADAEGLGMFSENMAAMTYLVARDVVLQGGKLSQARIEVHSTNETNTKVYQRGKFRFKLLGIAQTKKAHHAVLYRSLSELVDQLKPWGFAIGLSEIMKQQGLTPEEGIALHEELKRYQVHILDLHTNANGRPVGLVQILDASFLSKQKELIFARQLKSKKWAQKFKKPLPLAGFSKNTIELSFMALEGFLSEENLRLWHAGFLHYYQEQAKALGLENTDEAIAKCRFFTLATSQNRAALESLGYRPFAKEPNNEQNTIMYLSGRTLLTLKNNQAKSMVKNGILNANFARYNLE